MINCIAVYLQNRDFFGAKLIHIPFLHELRIMYPSAQIHLFAPYKSGQLFLDLGLADQFHQYGRGVRSNLKLLNDLKIDAIYNFRPEPVWLNIAILLSRAREKYSLNNSRLPWPGRKNVYYDVTVYRADAFAAILQRPYDIRDFFNRFEPSPKPVGEKWLCLLPGGGAGEFKKWGIDNYLSLAQIFSDHRIFVILGPEEASYVMAIEAASGGKFTILQNKSLPELVSIFRSTDLFIANDCGPAHIAQMLLKPLVMILSDVKGMAHAIAAEWFKRHEKSRIVIGESGQDIKSISVERVMEAVRDIEN
jgi:ADP-heptose:LPS heptosyltransferase